MTEHRVLNPAEHRLAIEMLWHSGLPGGDKTGWPSLDRHYTVVPGQLTVLTGWPGAGKSEWLDALLVNLSRQAWKIAFFSPENQPATLHVAKLLEKMIGKPFGRGPTERMVLEEAYEYLDELGQWCGIVMPANGEALPAQTVIDAAEPFFAQIPLGSKRGLVIDPWNELEHWRPRELSETEYISQTLSLVRNWARARGIHVWIVAHPQKMRREDGKLPIPRPDMIAGSQHWWNKADCAITVWRDFDRPDSQEVQIHVQKIRFKNVGYPGVVALTYDRVTGRYHEPPPKLAAVSRGARDD